MKKFKEDEIVILLGAGTSCDAGIKNSNQIISDIENRLKIDGKWKKFSQLYYYIKSIFYQRQLYKGISEKDVNFNIENLVSQINTIISIKEKDLEIYSFVGSWEKDLEPFLSEERYENLAVDFKQQIIKALRGDWLMPTTPKNWIEESVYFKQLIEFKKEYDGCPLKIFTLNYDRCVEQNLKGENIEFGFNEVEKWDSKRYDYANENKKNDYYLYKLHGSIDWKKKKEEQLTQFSGDIDAEDLAIIFGISNKLQSYDPYLFYFYEFRIHCLKAELVICSGYGFLDGHINDVIKHGFADNKNKRLIVNIFEPNRNDEEIINEISSKLLIDVGQITLFNRKAKEFYNEDLKLEKLSNLFADNFDDLPFGI